MEIKEFITSEKDVGKRLDVYLTDVFGDKSRAYIQGIIEKGNVKINSKIQRSNYKLKENLTVNVVIQDLEKMKLSPEEIKLDIVYEDCDVIVVNKPQGMVVHPAAGIQKGTLVNALLNHCTDLSGINGVMRPGIVHRIDKDTSGLLVVAKNDNAHNKLAEQLKNHSMTRIYIAIVEGVIKNDSGTIEAPLGRHPVQRIKMAVVKEGKQSVTHYNVLKRYNKNTLIECHLETGRTHQIRVHMAYIGFPLVGDPVYGFKKQNFNLKGQMLHAKKLGFIHPTTNEYIEFDSALPDYFQNVLNVLKNDLHD
jgi:23S rRNA pseudouridine1911/1915/1917 synthase